ncbi:MAG TPA: hypothetical protein PKC23_10240 [Candidatus Desulfobacillus sp.]|nr:hypothetical protein [Candidatus Desulfobacillus sp.]
MQDWATFFFTGSGTLPAFMVMMDGESFGLALMVFIGLIVTACLMGLRDEDCPARKAVRADSEQRQAERRQRRD